MSIEDTPREIHAIMLPVAEAEFFAQELEKSAKNIHERMSYLRSKLENYPHVITNQKAVESVSSTQLPWNKDEGEV